MTAMVALFTLSLNELLAKNIIKSPIYSSVGNVRFRIFVDLITCTVRSYRKSKIEKCKIKYELLQFIYIQHKLLNHNKNSEPAFHNLSQFLRTLFFTTKSYLSLPITSSRKSPKPTFRLDELG
jgi:hypothetical protein